MLEFGSTFARQLDGLCSQELCLCYNPRGACSLSPLSERLRREATRVLNEYLGATNGGCQGFQISFYYELAQKFANHQFDHW